MKNYKNIKGKKVCVIGAGLSGIHASVLAAHHHANVFLSEGQNKQLAPDDQELIKKYDIDYEIGGHTNNINDAELYIISPGIPKDSTIYQKLKSIDKPLVSEIEFASWFVKSGKIIAVTGTNGKSTTVKLIKHLFNDTQYNSYLGGNIGTPFSQIVLNSMHVTENKVFILEISSFQMEDIINFRPFISVMLNITADHLDRYQGDIKKYLAAKLQIASNQTKNEYYYYNKNYILLSQNLPQNTNAIAYNNIELKKLIKLNNDGSIQVISGKKLKIRGNHNYENILAALACTGHFEIPEGHLITKLQTFKGLPHRLEFVRELEGIKFFNDSKSTNIDAVIKALNSFQAPLVLILGGQDKGLDFSQLIPHLKNNTEQIILMGEAANKIRKQLADNIPTVRRKTMHDVVMTAFENAPQNSIVLLSPGCASYDMYDNYKQRGNEFKKIVNRLKE